MTVEDFTSLRYVSIFGVAKLPFLRPVKVHDVVVLVHVFPVSARVTTYE
jgi:hypothetical protein